MLDKFRETKKVIIIISLKELYLTILRSNIRKDIPFNFLLYFKGEEMNSEKFNEVLEKQIQRVNDVLGVKATEYATEDRLHNFKIAAKLQKCSPKQALAGMLAKHTVSIYDMCESDKTFSNEQWDEKITDHINYLILLRAIIEDEKLEPDMILYADGKPITSNMALDSKVINSSYHTDSYGNIIDNRFKP